MISVRYAVCSEREKKPVTRLVCDSRQEAEKALERVRREDAASPETDYWIAELGPECEGWRWLGREGRERSSARAKDHSDKAVP